jgi:hypothetical protein
LLESTGAKGGAMAAQKTPTKGRRISTLFSGVHVEHLEKVAASFNGSVSETLRNLVEQDRKAAAK